MDIQEMIRQGQEPWWASKIFGNCMIGGSTLAALVIALIFMKKMSTASHPSLAAKWYFVFWSCAALAWGFGAFDLGANLFVFSKKQNAWFEETAKPYVESLPAKEMKADGAEIEKPLGNGLYQGTVYYVNEEGFRKPLRGTFRAEKAQSGESALTYKEVERDLGGVVVAGKYMAVLAYEFEPLTVEESKKEASQELLTLSPPKPPDAGEFYFILGATLVFNALFFLSAMVDFKARKKQLERRSEERQDLEENENGREIATRKIRA